MNSFNANKIKQLINASGILQRDFAKQIGISLAGLQYIFNSNSTNIETLIKISDYFNVPVGYFFDQSSNSDLTKQEIINNGINNGNFQIGNNNRSIIKLNECQKEVEHLRLLIKEKEKVIKLYEELSNKNNIK